jgi:16S rRNA (guanine527-N7)-methyltransferase
MASHRSVDARSRFAELALRYDLPADASARFAAVLEALAAEPDPHTSVGTEEAVDVHIADSLSALEVDGLRPATRVADIGSGAGFPGLPLAIALPHTHVYLIESASRKAAVIERLAAAGRVANAAVIAARAEDVAHGEGREGYDAVTARAVAPLAVLVEYAAPLLVPDGVLVAWKGARDSDEEGAGVIAARQVGLTPADVLRVNPYDGSRNRHLHVFKKAAPTPERFPRRPGMAAKRPLA